MNDDVRGHAGDEPGVPVDVSRPHCDPPAAAAEPDRPADVARVRLRLDIAYDGTDFAGWAHQPGLRTVAGEIWTALYGLFADPVGLTVAGRTDSGVHATGQVAHVDVPAERWARFKDRPLWRLRGILPSDVRITDVTEVPFAFNARFSALSRRYVYRVADTVWGADPLRRVDTVPWPRPLGLDAMNAAATVLLGEHDFAAFCKRRDGATTVRALRTVGWDRDTEGVARATVVADAFCHSMVRSLVGAMLAVGEGRRDPAWLAHLLALRERSGAVHVAPANGLTLVEVEYPHDPRAWADRQAETRRVRAPIDTAF